MPFGPFHMNFKGFWTPLGFISSSGGPIVQAEEEKAAAWRVYLVYSLPVIGINMI